MTTLPPRLPLGTVLLVAWAVLLCGCTSPAYLMQAVRGHHQVMAARTPCRELIEDPRTSTELKTRLLLAGQLCDFAGRELGLAAQGDYRHYADLGRSLVVWNVYAAREFSVNPKTWRYPVVGALEYRGYFDKHQARDYAAKLAGKGWETHVEGALAYSTLGWFHDPLLNTFLWADEAALAETLFHELAHQRLFVAGDTDFNEAFATLVGREGARRWMRYRGQARALEDWENAWVKEERFLTLALTARAELERLYASQKATAKQGSSTPSLRERKRAILDQLCQQQAALWGATMKDDQPATQDSQRWNNARLNSLATYYQLLPSFEALLTFHGHDLVTFYRAVEDLADLAPDQRREALRAKAARDLARE